MGKVIFVLVDALGFDMAVRHCGFLEHMVEAGFGAKYRVRGELPALSRPMYETLLTGLPVWQHGIADNETRRRSRSENLFSMTRKAGLVNACAGYDWLSELYGGRPLPFDLDRDRYCLDGSGDIMHGIFYNSESYPDEHVYADGEFLRVRYQPDFLMIHPMGVDTMGHLHGGVSKEYAQQIGYTCMQIALRWEAWKRAGYQLAVTGDHGMDAFGLHEGNEAIQRDSPLYILSDQVKTGDFSGDDPLSSLDFAPCICRLLGIETADGMKPTAVRF